MIRRAVSVLTEPRESGLSAREAVAVCTPAASATSFKVGLRTRQRYSIVCKKVAYSVRIITGPVSLLLIKMMGDILQGVVMTNNRDMANSDLRIGWVGAGQMGAAMATRVVDA